MSDAHPFPAVNPDLNQIMLFVGRKGSGKSAAAREVFRAWPYIDKVIIDPTGDADPGPDLGAVVLRNLPADGQLPAAKKGEFTVTRYIANPGSPTYREDLDRAVGMALFPKDRRTLLWVDEAGEVFPAGRTGPHASTLLQQSRHWYASVIMCCPRPMNINPLCLSQADRVFLFDLPHPRDRERVAAAIGIEPKILNAELDATRARGEHWFLLYDAREHALYRCPPMPMSKGYAHAQQ